MLTEEWVQGVQKRSGITQNQKATADRKHLQASMCGPPVLVGAEIGEQGSEAVPC